MHSLFIKKEGSSEVFINGEKQDSQSYDLVSDGHNVDLHLDNNGDETHYTFKSDNLSDEDILEQISNLKHNKTKKCLLDCLKHDFNNTKSNNEIKQHLLKEFLEDIIEDGENNSESKSTKSTMSTMSTKATKSRKSRKKKSPKKKEDN